MREQTGQIGRKQEQKSIVLLKSKNGGGFFFKYQCIKKFRKSKQARKKKRIGIRRLKKELVG